MNWTYDEHMNFVPTEQAVATAVYGDTICQLMHNLSKREWMDGWCKLVNEARDYMLARGWLPCPERVAACLALEQAVDYAFQLRGGGAEEELAEAERFAKDCLAWFKAQGYVVAPEEKAMLKFMENTSQKNKWKTLAPIGTSV